MPSVSSRSRVQFRKARLPVAEHVESHQQGAVERAAGGCLYVGGAKEVFDSIAEQQFVTEDLLGAV